MSERACICMWVLRDDHEQTYQATREGPQKFDLEQSNRGERESNKSESDTVCVCMCVCVRERERGKRVVVVVVAVGVAHKIRRQVTHPTLRPTESRRQCVHIQE